MDEQIRGILKEHARLKADVATLDANANLYDVGLSSQATVSVMLGLEDVFGIEFPDAMFHRSVFATIGSIRHAVERIRAGEVTLDGVGASTATASTSAAETR